MSHTSNNGEKKIKVEYDFVYSKAVWPADVPTVTFSSGPPLLKCKVHLPLRPIYPGGKFSSSHAAAAQAAASAVPGLLDRARAFIASARMLSYSGMDASAQEAVESAFVNARQANPKVGQDDLHEWITHARLVALSHGESQLSLRRWQESREMEGLRKHRVNAILAQKKATEAAAAKAKAGPPPAGFGVVPGKKRTTAPRG